jgi:uncharacterized protein (DUF2062 family)
MSGLIGNFKCKLPTREWIASSRWTRPFAPHLLRPDLWRLNRRSVPRAVAIGLLIAPIVPVAHTIVAALAAVPTRANLVIAAAVTWLINPFTIPPFYYAAYLVGAAILRLDAMSPIPQVTHRATGQATHWAEWLLAKSGPLALGTLVMSVVIASVGYLVASFVWRWNIGRKWRARATNRNQAG